MALVLIKKLLATGLSVFDDTFEFTTPFALNLTKFLVMHTCTIHLVHPPYRVIAPAYKSSDWKSRFSRALKIYYVRGSQQFIN